MSKIELKNVTKYIVDKKNNSATAVLYDVNCVFESKKFTIVLGESGAGKTMMLKTIAGLLDIDSGDIYFNDENYTNTLPAKRNIAMITQEYALYPHLSVFENVAYPLIVAKVPPKEIKERVNDILNKLNISLLASRKPKQLSGGQQQRVAIARALVKNPEVILFDEPLSNIDKNLKTDLMIEFMNIQKQFGITFIYVTHNLGEATAMGDNIVIINNGTIVETGVKKDLLLDKNSYLYKNFIEVEAK